MAWEGRYLVIGFAAGEIPKIPLNLVLLKGCDIVGVHWGAFVAREPAQEAANMSEIVRWCAEGKLSAHVHAVYPLSETAQALKDIAARKVMGKAIVKPDVEAPALLATPPCGGGRRPKASGGGTRIRFGTPLPDLARSGEWTQAGRA